MDRRCAIILATAAAGFMAVPARAQDVKVPRVEVGGNLSAVLSEFFHEEGPIGLLGGGPRFSANFTPRASLEFLAELTGPKMNSKRAGIYLAQVKIPFDKSHGTRIWSFTLGAVGPFAFEGPQPHYLGAPAATVGDREHRGFRVNGFNRIALGLTRDEPLGSRVSNSLAVQTFLGASGFSVRIAGGLGFGKYSIERASR